MTQSNATFHPYHTADSQLDSFGRWVGISNIPEIHVRGLHANSDQKLLLRLQQPHSAHISNMSLHKERALDQSQSSTSASTRKSLPKSSRNTLYGSTAYERESQQALHYGREAGPSREPIVQGKTEYDILKENHR